MSTTAILPSRTDDAMAFLTERSQAAADVLADEQWEREQRIERAVTFDDVLEELSTGCSDAEKRQFTIHLARATHADADALYMMLDAAKKRVIARRLAAGE